MNEEKHPFSSGWVVVDKPLEKTSTQMVGAVRRGYGIKKVGHAGTLDPLATGVVPVAIGEATKTVAYAQDFEKVYECRIGWGEQRSTDDLEGDVIQTSDKRPTLDQIKKLIEEKFLGHIEQTPPQFSAIKIDGKRAYDLARKGEKEIPIKSRTVRIDDIKIIAYDTDWVDLCIECGKGTYIRSIARDMGVELGCFGHIQRLKRLSVGPFLIEDAISLEKLEKYAKKAELEEYLLPLETALDDIPALPISASEASTLTSGGFLKFVSRPDFDRLEKVGINPNPNEEIIAYAVYKKPIAMIKVIGPEIRPVRIFNI